MSGPPLRNRELDDRALVLCDYDWTSVVKARAMPGVADGLAIGAADWRRAAAFSRVFARPPSARVMGTAFGHRPCLKPMFLSVPTISNPAVRWRRIDAACPESPIVATICRNPWSVQARIRARSKAVPMPRRCAPLATYTEFSTEWR